MTKAVQGEKWFLFQNSKIAVQIEQGKVLFPQGEKAKSILPDMRNSIQLGVISGAACYSAEIPAGLKIPQDLTLVSLRKLFGYWDEEMCRTAIRAFHILQWDRKNKFCSCCGASLVNKNDELAKTCLECGQLVFPRISPAIIVAVIKGDQILLAHNKGFPGNMYSVIAGFVEPGETLEECVFREVKEEVGVEVKDICYFGSQPWPFPDSLMVAFVAQYAGGEIKVDDKEVAAASWFSRDALPNIPDKTSISRQLIDWYYEQMPPRI